MALGIKLGNKRVIEGMMADVNVRPLVIGQPFHNDCCEELPVYDVLRRFLEIQQEQVIEGVNIIYALKELLELNAKLIEGSSQAQSQAQIKIEELLR